MDIESGAASVSVDDISFIQLSDSFFPTGLYTTSNGLESLFYSRGKKKLGYDDVFAFIKAYLSQQAGPMDCPIVGSVYSCIQKNDFCKLLELDSLYYFMRLIEETRSASLRSGIQLIRCVSSFVHNNAPVDFYLKAIKEGAAKGVYPVSFAVSCNAMNINKDRAGLMLLYGFTVSLVGAALRLGVLQHFDGQRIIHEMKPVILSNVAKNINRSHHNMWQFIPHLDIIQIQHEQMDSKMFIT